MRHLISSYAVALAAAAVCVGCRDTAVAPPEAPAVDLRFSFESGLEGWAVSATDTLVGGSGIPWWVRPSTSQAFEGSNALEFYMANFTDAAKIWIVRSITVSPNRPYRVTINYALGTRDYGTANLFSLITGVTAIEPRTAADLANTFLRDATGNGASSDVGYRWIDKRVELDVTANAEGRLYVVVGVWGTWETARTYYVDTLRVQVVAR